MWIRFQSLYIKIDISNGLFLLYKKFPKCLLLWKKVLKGETRYYQGLKARIVFTEKRVKLCFRHFDSLPATLSSAPAPAGWGRWWAWWRCWCAAHWSSWGAPLSTSSVVETCSYPWQWYSLIWRCWHDLILHLTLQSGNIPELTENISFLS